MTETRQEMRERYGDEPEEKLFRVDITMYVADYHEDGVQEAVSDALGLLRVQDETVTITEKEFYEQTIQ